MTQLGICRAITAGAVALAAMAFAAWLITIAYSVGCGINPGYSVSLGAGCVGVGYTDIGDPMDPSRGSLDWYVTKPESFPPTMYWWFASGHGTGNWSSLVPLWMPFVVLLAVASTARLSVTRHRRRLLRELCAGCGYARVGLTEGAACPECGVRSERAARTGE